MVLFCSSFFDIDGCLWSFGISSLTTGSQWHSSRLFLVRPTGFSRGHCWVDLTKNFSTPSPVRSISGPWKMLIYPSPHILCLSTYIIAATLSELRHQSTSRCISLLPKQFITNLLFGGQMSKISFTELKSRSR